LGDAAPFELDREVEGRAIVDAAVPLETAREPTARAAKLDDVATSQSSIEEKIANVPLPGTEPKRGRSAGHEGRLASAMVDRTSSERLERIARVWGR
jgi:hypothetical protein